MGEIIMVSSLRDSGGVSFYDLTTGSPFSHALKNCMCETGGLGVIGGSSSFSGKSGQGSGDYIVASQSKKPVINIWQWGKPQVQMQCRIQELTPSICVDTNGFYIFGGTKGGRIFCWEVSSGDLVMSWQAHYKAVTTMVMSSCGTFLVSGAEDGMIRTWDVPTLLTSPRGSGSKKNIPPFRSWTPHSLPIANIILQQAGVFSPSNFRAISVSADRTITIQEIYSNRQVAKIAFPEALTSCTSNHTMDVVYLGSASGRIYIMDLSVTAVALSAAHAKVIHADTGVSSSLNSTSFTGDGSSGGGSTSKNTHTLQEGNYSILIGHDKAVTSLVLARDNYTLVSVSMDGTVKIWNTISRQCLKEINPYNKAPLSNVMLLLRPEVIDGHGISSIHKPTLCPISHLRKYPDSNDKSSNSGSSSVTQLDGNASLKGRNRRFVGGQSYCDERKNPLDLVSNPDLLQPVDTSYRSIQPAQGHATSASMPGGEYVSLRPPEAPESDFSNMDVLPSPPSMSRQDTFGDEFYDNWKKNVRVRSVDSKSGLAAITETILDDSTEISTLSLEMQVQAWKRLASELQNQISNDSVCQEESESEIDELEEIESPKAQPSTQKKKKSGPAMIVLSETDRFKVPKNKGSGGGRKRYHEVYLEEQEREIAKKDEESAVKKMKKENKVGSQTSKTGVKVSKATPPQARTRRSKK